jgi:hypothetical protein
MKKPDWKISISQKLGRHQKAQKFKWFQYSSSLQWELIQVSLEIDLVD